MVESDLIQVNLDKAREVESLLAALDCEGGTISRLSADLGDLYAGAITYLRLLEEVLRTPPANRERLSDLLWDLWGEMDHLRGHLRDSVELVKDVASDVTDEDEVEGPADR